MNNKNSIHIKISEEVAKGAHATDVLLTTGSKDVSLLFFVPSGPNDPTGLATARVFMSHTTALQMAELIIKRLGPLHAEYRKLMDILHPSQSTTKEPKEDSEELSDN